VSVSFRKQYSDGPGEIDQRRFSLWKAIGTGKNKVELLILGVLAELDPAFVASILDNIRRDAAKRGRQGEGGKLRR